MFEEYGRGMRPYSRSLIHHVMYRRRKINMHNDIQHFLDASTTAFLYLHSIGSSTRVSMATFSLPAWHHGILGLAIAPLFPFPDVTSRV